MIPESSVAVFVLAGWLLGLVTGLMLLGIVWAVTG